jgi:hypothetical protein
MLEKDPLKRISMADVEDHPWVNTSFTVLTMPEDGWNFKTASSCESIININTTDDQDCLKELKKTVKVDLLKLKNTRSAHHKHYREKSQCKDTTNLKGHSPHYEGEGGSGRTAKRLEK